MSLVSSTLWSLWEGSRVHLDGSLHPDFQAVADTLAAQIEQYGGGAAVCIYHHGEPVVDLWGGHRDSSGNPWLSDTMAPSFSTTKGVPSTLMHIMVDRGLIDYGDRVADYWPEFAQAGKQDITLRHVLAHQSGLYHIRQMIDGAERMLDWKYMTRAIARAKPIHPPGRRTGYHGLTYGYLVGEILQRVTGQSFSDLVQKELVGPLNLDGMYVGAPERVLPRAAELIWPERGRLFEGLNAATSWTPLNRLASGASSVVRNAMGRVGLDIDIESLVDALAPRGISAFDFSANKTLRAAIPAANGLFTARSLARMYAALAGGGELDGVRLISARTLARATRVQTSAPSLAVLPIDMRWRLGYHGIFTTRGVPREAFGHFGFGGSGAWADPSRELAVALVVNCGMGSPFGDLRTARVSGAALACARARHRSRPLAEESAPGMRPLPGSAVTPVS